jgi:hypothetical protein
VEMSENPMNEDHPYQPFRTARGSTLVRSKFRKATETASSSAEIFAFLRDLAVIVGGVLGIVVLLRFLVAVLTGYPSSSPRANANEKPSRDEAALPGARFGRRRDTGSLPRRRRGARAERADFARQGAGVDSGLPLSTIWTVRSFTVLLPVILNPACGTSRTLSAEDPVLSVIFLPSGITAVPPEST